MKFMAINGSPRRNGNTAILLRHVLEGAEAEGFDTELVHLYDLDFKGCTSCFYCKRKDREHGICAMRDGLTDVLRRIRECDAVVFGSPIYFMNISSGLMALLERLFFSNMIYSVEVPTLFPRVLPSGFIYDMNMTEQQAALFHLESNLSMYRESAGTIFRYRPKLYHCYDTYQFGDYSRYESSMFDEPAKRRRREELFPQECRAVGEMGRELARAAAGLVAVG